MTEQALIFDSIEDPELKRKKGRYKIWMRVGQIIAVLLSLLLIASTSPAMQTTTIGAFIIAIGFLILALLSFWRPFIFLLLFSIISSGFLLTFIGFLVVLWDVAVEEGKSSAMSIFSLFYLGLNSLVVVGTVAAKKYSKLKRQQA